MKAMPTASRNRQILMDRIKGDTLQALAERHDLSIERCRVIVVNEGRRRVDDLARRLRANRKTREVEGFVIPGHSGPDFDMAMAYLRWCIAQLASRGIETQIHYRAVREGVVLGVEDVTPPRRRRETV